MTEEESKDQAAVPPEKIRSLKEILSVTIRIIKVFVLSSVCSLRNDMKADLFSIVQSESALSKRL